MGNFAKFHFNGKVPADGSEKLRIDRHSGRIGAALQGFRFIDDDTKQHVFYMPSLEISGYGDAEERAEEMAKFCLDQLFDDLIHGDVVRLNRELIGLGWEKNSFFNKEFSRASVDENGILQGMNAEGGKIERVSFAA